MAGCRRRRTSVLPGRGCSGLGALPLGLRAWADGQPARAEALLRRFAAFTPPDGMEWVEGYRRLAAPYLSDFDALRKLPVVAPQAEPAEHEKAIAATQALLVAMKVPGGPLRPQMEAHVDQLRRQLGQRQRDQEEQLSATTTEQAREEAAALERALDQIDPLRADYCLCAWRGGPSFAQSLDAVGPGPRRRPCVLWQAAEDFLRLLAEDLNDARLRRHAGAPAAAPAGRRSHHQPCLS